ncbi:hypothetical protein AAG570_011652 [Ranatra chinensis]|uniref:Choline transporter-like protein n=1 Tax=Ranatra chinensis TaxID=642074 RepID=A0ABD0Z9N2_9HEMI
MSQLFYSFQFGVHLIQDINVTWPYIVGALVISVVICLIVIILLRWIAGVVVWLVLLLILVLLGVGAYFSYKRYEYISKFGPIETNSRMLQGQWDEFVNRKELWMFLTILASAVGIILLLIIIFLRKRICIAITLIEEGSKAVGSVMSTLMFPIFPWIFQCLVLVWAISIGLYLSSMGNPIFKVHDINGSSCECTGQYKNLKNGDMCESNLFDDLCHTGSSSCTTAGCRFYGREVTWLTVILQLVNAFGAFWGVWFVSGLSDMVLAATFATWYWTFHKRNVPFFTLTEAFMRTVTYHLGTVAFGSLIIAICSFIRAMIEYTERKIKKYENTCIKVIFCCCRCFFWCLEKFLRFISKNAYIMCAIHGKNFCLSARDAFSLLMRNVIRVVVVDKVTDFLFFIGKIVVTAIVVAGSYFFFIRNESIHINYIWLPLVIIAAGTYIVTCIFFGVYSMAVDTLFLCFLEDCERNDGSPQKPYYMSKNLMKVLGKHNRKVR